MLSAFLACDDLYETARFFAERLGWRQVFATEPDSGDPLACVSLGDAQILLGPATERWLAAEAREHRGAGVTLYISLSGGEDIAAIWRRHAAAGVTTGELSARPWGEQAFDAVIAGYRFLISQETLAGDA